MRIGVLGTTLATDASGPVALGGPRQRALRAALAMHRGRAVAVDTLADLVWNGAPPRPVSPAPCRDTSRGCAGASSRTAPRAAAGPCWSPSPV